jgi:hypothetical protein
LVPEPTDDDEKGTHTVSTLGDEQETLTVSEAENQLSGGDRHHVTTENRPISKPMKKRSARPNASKRARALLREQLANGPKPGDLVEAAAEAAEIPERSLIRAADKLGVRTQRGQWWLPVT